MYHRHSSCQGSLWTRSNFKIIAMTGWGFTLILSLIRCYGTTSTTSCSTMTPKTISVSVGRRSGNTSVHRAASWTSTGVSEVHCEALSLHECAKWRLKGAMRWYSSARKGRAATPPHRSVMGVLLISWSFPDAPLVVSLPHFLNSNPSLISAVDGLKPDEDSHDFFIDVEPVMGIPVRASARMQMNVVLDRFDREFLMRSALIPWRVVAAPPFGVQVITKSVELHVCRVYSRLSLTLIPSPIEAIDDSQNLGEVPWY